MKISTLKNVPFSERYGIMCSFVPKLGDRDNLYSTFCRIPSGEQTTSHSHYESELFYIIRGHGLMTIDDETETVNEGDLIRIPSLARHELRNNSSEDLTFLSVYSEDIQTPFLPESSIITAAPPTPNGPLHLGHISGPYLASDVLSRYLRSKSLNVLSHCGTDDHQNYVAEKAHAIGVSSKDFREQMRFKIQNGLTKMNITFDEFIEPYCDLTYQNKIIDFVDRAIKSGVIYKKMIALPYCKDCDCFLIDSRLDGNCPCCKEKSHGACENCGMVSPPQHLENRYCSRCHAHAEIKIESCYVFNLSQHLPIIKQALSKSSLTPRLHALIDRTRSMKELEVVLTYPDNNEHGLRLPNTNQLIHVWFEMAAHYEQFSLGQQFWTHCFGFDNGFYYLLFIPALLCAMNPLAKLPDAVITNDFLRLDGCKFSTSRNHAIWADEFSGNVDLLRLYLCLNRPSTREDDFSMKEFQAFEIKLNEQLRELNHRAKVVSEQKAGIVAQKTLFNCNRITRDMESCLSPTQFDLRRASRQLISFIDLTLQSIDSGSDEWLMLQTLAMLMSPFMPTESKRLLESLNKIQHSWVQDWSVAFAIA